MLEVLTLSADKTYVDKLSFPWPRKKSSSRQGEILGVLTLPGDKTYVDKKQSTSTNPETEHEALFIGHKLSSLGGDQISLPPLLFRFK
jgi:hypothetical protein